MFSASQLKYDENGLIPAVVQDFYTGEVLTVAYMNQESLNITLKEKRTCFWSRSRKQLWRKGETSGNRQQVVCIKTDCDTDALVIQVIKAGPACHTGAESCFYNILYQDAGKNKFSLEELYNLVKERKAEPREGSYTSYLFNKGMEKILKKVGEESTEVVIAAMKRDDKEIVFEISDLCYHILVLMAERGITPGQIARELEGRHVVDHKVKQETMQ